MHRRAVLRAGLVVPAVRVRGWQQPTPVVAGTGPTLSCSLRTSRPFAATPAGLLPPPFTQPLPIPPERSGSAVSLVVAEAEVGILPGRPTRMLTYDGTFPGPTVLAQPGVATDLLVRNAHHSSTVVHLHGGHVPAESDGHPDDVIYPGEVRTYRYPNRQAAATLWYHDHTAMATAPNVWRGLAGLYLLRDPDQAALGLPVGDQRDIPLVLTDRSFDTDGQLAYPEGARDGVLGDVPLVNGAVRPVATVPSTLLRLRILNASNARPYRLRRDDGGPLVRIAGDGGLLAAPLAAATVELWPGERVELLLDLGGRYGSSVTLVDDLAFTDGLVRFTTNGQAERAPRPASAVGVPAGVSEVLAPHPDLPAAEVVRDVVLTLDVGSARWLLNGHGFQSELVDYRCRMGAVERWRLINRAPGSHPMHLHLASFLVRGRSGTNGQDQPLEEGDVGWKDTVVVRPGQIVEVDVRFTDHPGTFVYHCHILEHEDHDMMSQFAVLPVERLAGTTRIDTAVAVARRAFPDGAATVLVAAAADFPDALAAGPVAARLGGPLLLTDGDRLPAAVAEEIRRLGPARVIVVGGTAVISDDVLAALGDLAAVQRIAGTGRDATAAALARHAFDRAEQVWLASGTDFPDALVASAAAARDGAPLLLVGRDHVAADTLAALGDLEATDVVLVGGPAVISPKVEALLADAGLAVRRLGGGDRFATAAAAARAPDPPEGVAPAVLLVTGLGFADALTAAPLAAVLGAPLLLADATLPPVTATAIAASGATRLVVVGGDAVVPVAVEEAAMAWLSPG